jgi:hypothetical protein
MRTGWPAIAFAALAHCQSSSAPQAPAAPVTTVPTPPPPDARAQPEAGTVVDENVDADNGGSAWKAFDGGSPCRWGPDILALPPIDGRCDQAKCASVAGTCAWGGFGCDEVCSRRTRDGGKACTDAAQCEANCLAPPKTPKGQRVSGTCRDVKVGFGCQNTIRAGVAEGEMCAD